MIANLFDVLHQASIELELCLQFFEVCNGLGDIFSADVNIVKVSKVVNLKRKLKDRRWIIMDMDTKRAICALNAHKAH